MKSIEVIGLFTKDYLSNREFEEWVYGNDEQLNKLFSDTIYYEVISTNYNDNKEVATLKNKLQEYLLSNNYDEFNKINDGYVEKVIDDVKTNDEIINILKQKYGQKDKVEINCSNINSLTELHKVLKEKLEFSQYYVMNWHALREFLEGTLMPKILIFNGWSHLNDSMPNEAEKLKEILVESISNECKVIYKD
ncbi:MULTISPECIES: barstar family protein [unclassified Clostridium]|uniref:barstar family protein n=1 Tax=unclassified Clostridium TaxID=2614128 RepID=UPI000A171995|nr:MULTISPECIES: barstar family protein [unclassified Clostridium]